MSNAQKRPRIISITHSKGGVGKTTLAVNLLHQIQSKGKKAILFDTDLQRTAVDFAQTRAAYSQPVSLNIQELASDDIARVPELAAGYDYAILDTPGSVSLAYREAITAADVVLMPMVPGPAEIWAFRRAFGTIQELTAAAGKLVLVFYTQVPPRSSILTDLAEEQTKMENDFQINFLESSIVMRSCWRNSFFHGNTVIDATGKQHNKKAIAELAALYSELNSTLKEYDSLSKSKK